ncbi:ABC transporter permease subunit [Clostridium sp. CTA-19]
MLGLLQNEWLKFFKSKRFIIFCISLIIIFFYGTFIVLNDAKKNRPDVKIDENTRVIFSIKDELKNENISKHREDELNVAIEKLEEENRALEIESANEFTENREYIKGKIDLLKSNDIMNLSNTEKEDIKSELKYYEYILSNDLLLQKNYEITAFGDITKIIGKVSIILLPILIILASCDCISSEYDNLTIKQLLAKPVPRGKIFISKFISTSIAIIGTVTFIEIVNFILIGLKLGFGSYKYPILVGTKYELVNDILEKQIGSTNIIEAWKVIVLVWIIQIIFILTIVSVQMMVSTFLKSTVTSLSVSSIAVALISLITFYIPLPFIRKILLAIFTTYSNGMYILTGELKAILLNNSINLNLSIIVMTIWIIVSFVIGYRVFTKEDIL